MEAGFSGARDGGRIGPIQVPAITSRTASPPPLPLPPTTGAPGTATPDVTINTANSVNVVVQASNIPLGTVVTLDVTADQGGDQQVSCPGLTGTLASSTTTCSVVFQAGMSRGYITASW